MKRPTHVTQGKARPPESPRVKRSNHVTLVLMTAAGIGGVAYALTPSDSCRQVAPSAVTNDAQQNCRSSSHGGSSSHFYSSNSGTGSSGTSTATSSATSSSSSRGVFGSTGQSFASFGGS